MKNKLIFIASILLFAACQQPTSPILYQTNEYTIYTDSVVQAPFSAVIVSATEMHSNYISPNEKNVSSAITFKFSINSRDNEMVSGTDHHVIFDVTAGNSFVTEVKFGEQLIDTAGKKAQNLPANCNWTIRMDMTHIFNAFETDGYFTLFDGSKIYKDDFKAVYIAGGTEPLSWDFENLHNKKHLKLADPNNDHIYEVKLMLNPEQKEQKTASWKLESDISALPQFKSDIALLDAMYNMSLDELIKNMRPDKTYNTGKEWEGVWTRDVSYSTLLSLAIVQPQIAQNSLMRKVKNDRIIQDTGTGGAWPVSTDRTTWALAAWEIYKVTGDSKWLEQAFGIIKNSIEDDLQVAFDNETGLMCGESSFLDWREQTYPKWMEPVDIYMSKTLGTNAVHYQTFMIASKMAEILNLPNEKFIGTAEKIKQGINKYLWMDDKGYYAQYLYGKNYSIVSPRSEALGEALCVLFDIADDNRQKKIVSNTPTTAYGIPCISPQIPNIQPYHNNGIWPFVESFWALASAKVGNEKAVTHSLGAIYRQAALFLTNKENMVAENGDYAGTAINSDRQLWSVAGNLAITYRLFFGLDFQDEKISFKPFVPKAFAGDKELTNFKYRNMVLDIKISGYGNHISSFKINGSNHDNHFIDADISGNFVVEIELDNQIFEEEKINLTDVKFSLTEVKIDSLSDIINLSESKLKENIRIYRNGQIYNPTDTLSPSTNYLEEYMVVTQSDKSAWSFAAKPFALFPENTTQKIETESFTTRSKYNYNGFSGKGFVEISPTENTEFLFNINIEEEGQYAIDFRYANGTGPVNTDNNCAIRTLWHDSNSIGAIILPQRGTDEWSNWGFTNARQVYLPKGKNQFKLTLESYNQNMDGEINTAMIDFVRIVRLKQ